MSLSDTSVLSITQSLLSAGVLNRHECDAVHAKATPLEKVSALTATMMRKGPSAYPNFYGALEECDPTLYEQLTGIKGAWIICSLARSLGRPVDLVAL
ncbi:unnamed protein product [Lampetra planeri]